MVTSITGGLGASEQVPLARGRNTEPGEGPRRAPAFKDQVAFGSGGRLSDEERTNLVVERALARLRSVVDDARKDLGIEEGSPLDISPEATAGRIVGFALNFFDTYAKKNGLENNEDGRRQFADFIGGAISQGIDEARGILGALNALDPETGSNIDKTASIISNRLEDFVKKGL